MIAVAPADAAADAVTVCVFAPDVIVIVWLLAILEPTGNAATGTLVIGEPVDKAE